MKKNLFKGISFTVGASLWWGIIGVIYFKFVSYASPLELTIHRTIWTALLLVITTSYYAKWSEFKKIIKFKVNIFILFLTGLLVSITWFTCLYTVSTNKLFVLTAYNHVNQLIEIKSAVIKKIKILILLFIIILNSFHLEK